MPKAKKATKEKIHLTKLPSVWQLLKKTWLECVSFRRPLFGVLAIFGILYLIMVLGLSLSNTWQDYVTFDGGRTSDALTSILGVFSYSGLGGDAQSDAKVLVQFLLFIIGSMAFVWTLRKLQAIKKIKIRDAYYQGTAAFVPTVLVSVVLILMFLPALIGSSILTTALSLISSGFEVSLVALISGLLFLLTLVLFFMLWPAFYIVSLPQTKPMQALKSAAKITKKRRLAIVRKAIVWAFICLVVLFAVLFIFALVWSAALTLILFIMLLLIFGCSHVYFYNLYRSLL